MRVAFNFFCVVVAVLFLVFVGGGALVLFANHYEKAFLGCLALLLFVSVARGLQLIFGDKY